MRALTAEPLSIYGPNMELSRLLARNFRSLRTRYGPTQELFGDRSGLSQSQISRLERAENWKQIDHIAAAIARAGGDPEDLLMISGEAADPKVAEIRQLLPLADDATLDIVLAVLRRLSAIKAPGAQTLR